MGFGTRQPTSNEPPQPKTGKSPWLGETDAMDEFALKVNGLVATCLGCKRLTHKNHLDGNQLCPGCDH